MARQALASRLRSWRGIAILSLVAILALWFAFFVGDQGAGISRHRVSMVTATELSREVLGTRVAEFPIVMLVGQGGYIVDTLRGFPEGVASKLDDLGSARATISDARRPVEGLSMITPLSDTREKLVLVTLVGGCEPCRLMDAEFTRLVRRRADLAGFVVEAHVDAK